MCTYLTHTTQIAGSGLAGESWIKLRQAVVSFDHPVEAPVEHALCIDLRTDADDPSSRLFVELDAASARRLAETILATLDSEEARAVL